MRARDIMTTAVVTVHIRRVPVVVDGLVVGIASRANLVQALATSMRIFGGWSPPLRSWPHYAWLQKEFRGSRAS
jgi:hypothetical protein